MPPSRALEHTLLTFAEAFAEPTAWAGYQSVRNVGPDALSKLRGGWDEPGKALSDIPYDDPTAAAAYDRRLQLERSFADELVRRAREGEWLVEAREEDDITFTRLDGRLLALASLDFQQNALSVVGRRFAQVTVRRTKRSRFTINLSNS